MTPWGRERDEKCVNFTKPYNAMTWTHTIAVKKGFMSESQLEESDLTPLSARQDIIIMIPNGVHVQSHVESNYLQCATCLFVAASVFFLANRKRGTSVVVN